MFKQIKISLILALSFIASFSFAQSTKVDSLLIVLSNSTSIEKMETLRQITKEYMNNSVEDAIRYANELLKFAEENKNLQYTDLASSFLGELYFYIDEIDKSIYYFEKFLEINILQDDTDGIATAYNNLGIVYRYIEEYEKAIQYYLESVTIKESLKDSAGLSNTYNNIGVMYFHMGDYYLALEYYNRSFDIETNLNNKSGIATSLLNIGEIYGMINKYDKALSNFQRSIEICEEIDDKYTLEINYKCLYEMYKRQVKFQKALYYYELFNELNNSRLNKETRKEIAELEIKYESSEKQREIEILNKQNELKKLFLIILSSAFFIFSVLVILLYKQGREKKRALELLSIKNNMITEQTEILNRINSTKDKFFSIISHDLKGAIGGFLVQTAFLADDFKHLSQEDTHDLIIKMNQSSEQLYNLLENLLEWSQAQTGSLKIKKENFNLKELIDGTIHLFQVQLKEKKINAIVEVDKNIEMIADLNMISTVLRNLIVNAIKFSYPKSSFVVSGKKTNNEIEIKVSDKGIGIKEKDLKKLFKIDQSFSNPGTEKEKGSGLGLIICKEFIELNNGKLEVKSTPGKGTTFTIKLKTC